MEYPKTENLYARDPDTHVVGPENGFRQKGVGLIRQFLVLEKLDGMNMRVIWRPHPGIFPALDATIDVYGRTDKATIPGDLMTSIRSWATHGALFQAFQRKLEEDQWFVPEEVILFGEGIGPGIQGAAGAAYGGEKRFVLFDVVVDGWWLDWKDVVDIAGKLGIPHARVFEYYADLEYAIERTEEELEVDPQLEGAIFRTDPYLFDQRGRRIAAKYKRRDL